MIQRVAPHTDSRLSRMHVFVRYLAGNKRYWLPPILLWLALLMYLAWTSAETPVDPFEYRFD